VPGAATGSPGEHIQHQSRTITPHLQLIWKADLYCLIIAYWIAFGPHGPRAQAPPGEGSRVFFGTAIAVGASLALFGTTRLFAGNPPPTMNKEWQEAANEKLVVRFARIRPWPAVPVLPCLSYMLTVNASQEQRSDPLTGISSDFYTGKGQVQSPPKQ
jgi:cytochrome c oxidase subunit 4